MVAAFIFAACLLGARAYESCLNMHEKACDREADCQWKDPCHGKKCCQRVARPERPSGLGPRYDTRPANVSETSIIFIKIPKCSSSTAAGVARRVASRHGHVGFASTRFASQHDVKATTTSPAVYANHGPFVKFIHEFQEGGTWRAFLWTVVREPIARSVSAFFFFRVTRHHGKDSDHKIQNKLGSHTDYLWNYLRTDLASAPRPGDVDKLLDVYDLVGTTELFDETMVLLATRLGLPLGDVLSVSAKDSSVAGARDDRTGDALVHADASQMARVRKWAETTGFEARAAADYAIWRNASARVRRDVRPLKRKLAEYRRLKRAVADPCAADPRNFEEDQCLWRDNGCAQPCIDAGLARDAG